MTAAGTVRRRAARLGVEVEYEDVDHVVHAAPTDVLEQVTDRLVGAAPPTLPFEPVHVGAGPVPVTAALRDATLLVSDAGVETETGVTTVGAEQGTSIELPAGLPVGCHRLLIDSADGAGECLVVIAPPTMSRAAALDGRTALFTPAYALWERDRPLPSFDHLAELAAALPPLGVDALATLPLFAAFLDEPCDPSPYSPVSRLHWNEVYLDDTGLPDAPVPELGDLVDWRTLASRRRQQLLDAVGDDDAMLRARIDRALATRPDLARYGQFWAARADAGSDEAELVARSHVLAQLLAEEQLRAATATDGSTRRAALVLDLPVGSHPDGFETWDQPDLFAAATSVGAPPDTFFRAGQNWGFPPQLPEAMRASGYRLLRSIIEGAARFADVLRIDHVMATHRLWWIPDGEPADRGVYVRYRREELMAVIAATAVAAGVTIVGEDLGTVPPEVDESLRRWQMLGMYEEQFHLDDVPLPAIPDGVVAGLRTHDMEPFAALAAHTPLDAYRRRLAASIGHEIDATTDATLDSMLQRLADSDAYLVVADLDDLIGERRPHNVPGQVLPELWSRRLDAPTSETLRRDDLRRRLAILERSPT